jgi:hypothetical protein
MLDTWTRHPQPAWIRNGDRTNRPLNWPGAIIRHRAIHEAGHAVAMLALGRTVDRIWITDEHTTGTGHEGQVEFTWALQRGEDEQLAAMLAAGERTANMWLHVTSRWTKDTAWAAERGALSDRTQLFNVLGGTDRTERDLWEWACQAADRLLTGRWQMVGALADALLASPTLRLERGQINAIAARHKP